MTYLWAIVSTRQREGADFGALMHGMTTVGVWLNLLTTLAYLGNDFQAGGTISRMALNCALVTARVDLFASVIASRYRSLA
jgi:hypothetical protein